MGLGLVGWKLGAMREMGEGTKRLRPGLLVLGRKVGDLG